MLQRPFGDRSRVRFILDEVVQTRSLLAEWRLVHTRRARTTSIKNGSFCHLAVCGAGCIKQIIAQDCNNFPE